MLQGNDILNTYPIMAKETEIVVAKTQASLVPMPQIK